MKQTPMYWNGAHWIIQVPFTVAQHMLKPAIAYCLKVQRQRYASLSPGDARDDLARAIKALEQGRMLQQPVKNPDGYAKVFTSTPAIGDKIYSLGAQHG